MAHTEVLLVKPVEDLGGEGDQVKVRAGYARNFLFPRKIAVPLTGANRKQVDALKKRRAEREQTELNGAQDVAKKLEKTSLAFAVKTGEGGKMFGAITAQDIHAKLDNNEALGKFALTLERVCVDTVEAGYMTKDLALLVGADQRWLSTTGFLDKVAENLTKAMAPA